MIKPFIIENKEECSVLWATGFTEGYKKCLEDFDIEDREKEISEVDELQFTIAEIVEDVIESSLHPVDENCYVDEELAATKEEDINNESDMEEDPHSIVGSFKVFELKKIIAKSLKSLD